MTIPEYIANLKLLEGGIGREANGQEVSEGIDQSSYDLFCAHRGVPTMPVWNLTPEEIQNFYVLEYIAPLLCDQLPEGLDFCLFQAAVNIEGAGNRGEAVKMLQLCVGAIPDGIMGPETLAAVKQVFDVKKLISLFLDQQASYYEKLNAEMPDAPIRGWLDRISITREICGLTTGVALEWKRKTMLSSTGSSERSTFFSVVSSPRCTCRNSRRPVPGKRNRRRTTPF